MLIVDPFETLVTEAKDRLSQREGREISWRELARRAGYDDGREWGVFRNAIRPQRERRPDGQRSEGRRPNPEVVRRLAEVLPVSEQELNLAAAQTAGYLLAAKVDDYSTMSLPQLAEVIRAYVNDPNISEDERSQRSTYVLGALGDLQAEKEARVVDFPRRQFLSEAGAAAREADAERNLSDPDGSVD